MQDDSDVLQNLFTTSGRENLKDFTSSEYLYLTDFNNSSYSSGQIRFDTLMSKDQFVVYSDSYLNCEIEVKCAAGGTNYLEADPIAFKQSVIDLITGVQINSGNGETIVNESNSQHINRIRRLLDTSFSAQYSNMNDVHFNKDTALPVGNAIGPLFYTTAARVASNDPQNFIYSNDMIEQKSTTYNEGFDTRIRLFKRASNFAANTFSLEVSIPLRYIHPFFATLDFPLINQRFQINFLTPVRNLTTAVTTNSPFLHATNNSAGAAMSDAACSFTRPCRLYYRKVTFSSDYTDKISNMLKTGFTKTLEFPITDVYDSLHINQQSETTYTDVVSPSTVRPLRVWLLLQTTGMSNSQTLPAIYPGIVRNANVLINNQQYYPSDLTTDHDFWRQLEAETIANGYKDSVGSLIGFYDFKSSYRLHCFDVSRLKERIASPSEAVNIQVRSTRVGTSAVDYVYLVERLQVVNLHMSAAHNKIVIGSAK